MKLHILNGQNALRISSLYSNHINRTIHTLKLSAVYSSIYPKSFFFTTVININVPTSIGGGGGLDKSRGNGKIFKN